MCSVIRAEWHKLLTSTKNVHQKTQSSYRITGWLSTTSWLIYRTLQSHNFSAKASFNDAFSLSSYLHSGTAGTIHRCSGTVGQAGGITWEEGQYEAHQHDARKSNLLRISSLSDKRHVIAFRHQSSSSYEYWWDSCQLCSAFNITGFKCGLLNLEDVKHLGKQTKKEIR